MIDPARLPVPAALAERARQLAAGTLAPVEARPAATVLLLRDSPHGLQVYLLRRRSTMAFAGGMYAFPGGRVDPDRDGDDPYACAAARELFEETTVLLAGASPDSIVADTTGPDFEADRQALVGRQLTFGEFLDKRRLRLRRDLLVLCGHWVTPKAEVRRYDTRFYLAALPAGQRTRDVSGEADRVVWSRPTDVEAAVQSGEMELLPPTAAMIASLLPYATVAEAFEGARHSEVRPILPEVGFDADGIPRWSLPSGDVT